MHSFFLQVRQKLVAVQTTKERSEVARKLRDERKFAVQIQRDVLKERQSEKKILMEAVKKHKKGKKKFFSSFFKRTPCGFLFFRIQRPIAKRIGQ